MNIKHIACLLFVVSVALPSCRKAEVCTPPTMGWSSWNAFMTEISDSLIMDQADAMASSALVEAGYEYINIDDGYFGGRDEDGNLIVHPTRFPGGMNRVVDHIHGLGLKAGIYSDAGHNTCGSYYNRDSLGLGVGLYGHDAQDVEMFFNSWGFDFLKVDFCGGQKLKLSEKERFEEISEVIRSSAQRDVIFNVCRWNYPGTWVHDISDSWRISPDIRPSWKSIRNIINKNMYLSAYAWGGHYNDMDMLAVGYNGKPTGLWRGPNLTYEEEEAHFGMWCIMSSPLLLGCDMRFIPERTMEIITNPELIAVNQDPLGLQAQVIQHEGEGYVFAKDLRVYDGRVRAVALYNPSEEDITFDVPGSLLCLKGKMRIRDLNRRTDLKKSDCIHMVVPPHNARILKVSGKRMEQSLYEAEWGYVPAFNDINSEGGKYVPDSDASGGEYVVNLGGYAENSLQWKNVRLKKRGARQLELTLFPSREGRATLTVNGIDYPFEYCPKQDCGKIQVTVNAEFKKGDNIVSLSSSDCLPPVDCMRLK